MNNTNYKVLSIWSMKEEKNKKVKSLVGKNKSLQKLIKYCISRNILLTNIDVNNKTLIFEIVDEDKTILLDLAKHLSIQNINVKITLDYYKGQGLRLKLKFLENNMDTIYEEMFRYLKKPYRYIENEYKEMTKLMEHFIDNSNHIFMNKDNNRYFFSISDDIVIDELLTRYMNYSKINDLLLDNEIKNGVKYYEISDYHNLLNITRTIDLYNKDKNIGLIERFKNNVNYILKNEYL